MKYLLKIAKDLFSRKKATVRAVANFATNADARAFMNNVYNRTNGPNEALKETLSNPHFAIKGGAVARMAADK